jgi:hypothetical protein
MMNKLIPIIVVAVILILIVFISTKKNDISGFYTAPSSFLQKSGLTKQVFYFNKISNGSYDVYIYMQMGDDVIINGLYTCNLSNGNLILDKKFSSNSDDEDEQSEDTQNEKIDGFLPKKMSIKIENDNCKISLMEDDTLWVLLYKDCELSDLASVADASQ